MSPRSHITILEQLAATTAEFERVAASAREKPGDLGAALTLIMLRIAIVDLKVDLMASHLIRAPEPSPLQRIVVPAPNGMR